MVDTSDAWITERTGHQASGTSRPTGSSRATWRRPPPRARSRWPGLRADRPRHDHRRHGHARHADAGHGRLRAAEARRRRAARRSISSRRAPASSSACRIADQFIATGRDEARARRRRRAPLARRRLDRPHDVRPLRRRRGRGRPRPGRRDSDGDAKPRGILSTSILTDGSLAGVAHASPAAAASIADDARRRSSRSCSTCT